jgi:alpha-tubulin suppressor-like RCC1 family protein
MAIKTNGTLWTWGNGASGAQGRGNTSSSNSPAQVGSDTDWFKLLHTGLNVDALFAMNDAGEIYHSGTGVGAGITALGNVSSFTQIGSDDGFTDAILIGTGLVAYK